MAGSLRDSLKDDDTLDRWSVDKQSKGLDKNKLFGAIGLGAILLVGGFYLLSPGESGGLTGQDESAFTEDSQVFGGQIIVGANEPSQRAPEVEAVVVSGVSETGGPSPSSREIDRLEKRITDLTVDLAEAQATLKAQEGLVDELRVQKKQAEAQLADLESDLTKAHGAEMRALKDAHALEVQMLENRLKVLEDVGAGLSAEQQRLLEEAEKRRRAQIESESIIFDTTTEETKRIQY